MKKNILSATLIISLLFCYSVRLFSQSQIRGVVKLGLEGTPVPGITISISDLGVSTTTNESGEFVIGVPSGAEITLSATYSGHPALEKTFTPLSGMNWMNFWFDPPALPSDFDGNYYQTVTIGSQTWFASNLATTHFIDGSNITYITDAGIWTETTNPAFCWYNNNYTDYKSTYGALYNWYTVDSESNGGKNVCPSGWHVPSYADWLKLFDFLGGTNVAGGKLKGTGTIEGGDGLWYAPNEGATNETGFTALPGGFRWDITYNGVFGYLGVFGVWWSTTEYEVSSNDVFSPTLGYMISNVSNNVSYKEMGLSVRCLMNSADFTVINTNDEGPGSLRQAILNANSSPETDIIVFDIPGEGVHTIQPLTPLPNISESVVIDGYSQPGATRATGTSPANLLIELDGSLISSEEPWQEGLSLWGGSSIIRGLMINNFGDAGIHIEGRLDQQNVAPCINNIIEGNYIGVDRNGELKANKAGGIRIWRSTGNIIGGDLPENRNVISGGPENVTGNGTFGIFILLPESVGNIVKGNYIGIGPDGETPLNSPEVGIRINEGAHNNIIGPGNVISGNLLAGIQMEPLADRNSHDNLIIGNYIGTNASGTKAVPNGNGIRIFGAVNNIIGGIAWEEKNIISGNAEFGIEIVPSENFPGSGNQIIGNSIGTNVAGNIELGNGSAGLKIFSDDNIIGLNEPDAGNLFAYNKGNGIVISVLSGLDYLGTGNAVSGNSIHSNDGIGIDLGDDNITVNDINDADTGPNNLQNFPVISSVSFSPGVVNITGILNSEPEKEYTLEFFANKTADNVTHSDGKHYGEGEKYLGNTKVTTGADGNASFSVSFPIKSGDGQVITATATDPEGNTSEFSKAVGGLADQEVGTGWPLHYKYNELGVENITNGTDITAVINSFNTWAAVPTATVSFTNDGPTAEKYANASDGINLVSFVDDKYPWSPGVLAYAAKTVRMDENGETGQIIDADIIVNPDFINNLTGTLGVAGEEGTPGYFDIQSVITHEIGHLLGLIHTGVVDATMFFWLRDGTTSVRSLEPDDKAWVSYKYPGLGYISSYGTVSGNITYGDDSSNPPVAGALVIAENEEGSKFHAYSDALGNFIVPVESSGSYTLYVQPLDGDVYGYPMKPGNISPYIYSNTVYTDYPNEYFSGTAGEAQEATNGIDLAAVSVTPGNSVSIATNPDKTAPDILSITPASGSVVKVLPDIIIRFSEPIETGTLSDATCYLESGGNKYIGSFTEIGGNSDVILFTPYEPLGYDMDYSLHLEGIKDLKGNTLVNPYPPGEYSIRTVSADQVSPVVTSIIPEDETTGVFVTEKIMVFFSEPMNRSSVESAFNVGCSGNPDIEGSFSWKNENTLMTFTPLHSFQENNLYTVSISVTAADLSGNPMEAEYSSSFTTVPESAPAIVYLEPGELLTSGVSITTPVVADFTEPVDPASVNSSSFTLKQSDGTPVSGTFEFLNQNSRVIFRPDAVLSFSSTYTVELKGGETGIKDASQPAMSMVDNVIKPFTTASMPVVPDIFYIDPPAGVSGTIVKIEGEGFDPDPSKNIVTFVTIPAYVREATLNSLTVEVPRGALSGMVKVNVNGTLTEPGFYFYVVPQSLDPCEEVVTNVSTETKSRDVAVTPDGATAYVTNSGANSVSVIDLVSLTKTEDIEDIGATPLKIEINPLGTRAYVTNFDSHTVSVIDIAEGSPTHNQVIKVINVGINPYGVVVTPDGDRVYVSNYSSNNLSVIDADPNSGGFDHVVTNINTETKNRDITVTGDAGLVLVAGDNGLTIVNARPGDVNFNSVITNVSSGTKTIDVAVTGDAGFAVVSTEDGYLMVIDIFPGSDFFGTVLTNLASNTRVKEVTTSGDDLHIYVTTEDNQALVYQLNPGGPGSTGGSYPGSLTLTLHATIENVGNEGLVIDPRNERLLTVNSGSGTGPGALYVIRICCGPLSPENAIGKLIIAVQTMINNGAVKESQGDALIKKLTDALNNLSKGKIKTAINNLNEFIAKVNEYMAGGKLPQEQGYTLIESAKAIIAQLKGTKSEDEESGLSEYKEPAGYDGLTETQLGTVYPNPFSEAITINYEVGENLKNNEKVQISIYDIAGRLVGTIVNKNMEAGRYSAVWNGRYERGGAAPRGTYFIRLKAGNIEEVKQIMLVR